MTEAVVDLPDPMSLPPSAENADELLSQLAGEQIDRLLSEAEGSPPVAPTVVLPEAEAPVAQPIAIPLPTLPAVEPATPATVPAVEHDETHEAEADGWLVRLLELFNSPFAACPEEVRDLLGKLAILFFINAVGFILYALLAKHR